jgi:hypothetical protein
MASDIQKCQAKGKIVTMSLGGGTAKVGFNSDFQAASFAHTIWDMFLGMTFETVVYIRTHCWNLFDLLGGSTLIFVR